MRKVLSIFLCAAFSFSCAAFKEIRTKDVSGSSSFAVISFARYNLEGRGLKAGFLKDESVDFFLIKKYIDLDLKEKSLYSENESLKKLNFKIESMHDGKSSCSVGLKLIAIDRERKRVIGFASKIFSGTLSENYEWRRFNSYENFNLEEQNKIKKSVRKFLVKGLRPK